MAAGDRKIFGGLRSVRRGRLAMEADWLDRRTKNAAPHRRPGPVGGGAWDRETLKRHHLL
jgi:hypothetical protein